jgi:p-aminobenzoyl-glutamate transporter AbgT
MLNKYIYYTNISTMSSKHESVFLLVLLILLLLFLVIGPKLVRCPNQKKKRDKKKNLNPS